MTQSRSSMYAKLPKTDMRDDERSLNQFRPLHMYISLAHIIIKIKIKKILEAKLVRYSRYRPYKLNKGH